MAFVSAAACRSVATRQGVARPCGLSRPLAVLASRIAPRTSQNQQRCATHMAKG
jgi:hypothetical protein